MSYMYDFFNKKYTNEIHTVNLMKEKLKKLKIDTIKESIYANDKKIILPKTWKNEKIVIDDLRKDKKFVNYLINGHKDPEVNGKIKDIKSPNNKNNKNNIKYTQIDSNNSRPVTSSNIKTLKTIPNLNSNLFTDEDIISTEAATRTQLITSAKSRIISSKTNKHLDKGLILSRLSTGRKRTAYPQFYTENNISNNEENKINCKTEENCKNNNNILNKNKKKKVENIQTDFIFLEYYQKFKDNLEIKNPKVKKLFNEVQLGPYSTHCPSCNRRNLEFFDKLRPETAISYLNNIREEKYKKYN